MNTEVQVLPTRKNPRLRTSFSKGQLSRLLSEESLPLITATTATAIFTFGSSTNVGLGIHVSSCEDERKRREAETDEKEGDIEHVFVIMMIHTV